MSAMYIIPPPLLPAGLGLSKLANADDLPYSECGREETGWGGGYDTRERYIETERERKSEGEEWMDGRTDGMDGNGTRIHCLLASKKGKLPPLNFGSAWTIRDKSWVSQRRWKKYDYGPSDAGPGRDRRGSFSLRGPRWGLAGGWWYGCQMDTDTQVPCLSKGIDRTL